ncbi:MAG: FmdB family zinc ribbon protein [bacterium]
MPTYEYLCDDCKYQFEEFQSITAAPLEVCPKCGGSVQRLISSGNGLIFKGSGFYITDYKKSNKNGNTEKKPEKKEEKSSEKNQK